MVAVDLRDSHQPCGIGERQRIPNRRGQDLDDEDVGTERRTKGRDNRQRVCAPPRDSRRTVTRRSEPKPAIDRRPFGAGRVARRAVRTIPELASTSLDSSARSLAFGADLSGRLARGTIAYGHFDGARPYRVQARERLRTASTTRSGPESVSWKVNREIVVVAGWGRAILLQLAHPLVAAGVDGHSTFRGSLTASFGRLWSTVGAMVSLTFGDEEEAISAAAGINVIHDRVSGRLNTPAGAFPAGEPYSAHDAELLRWVHATVVGSSLLTYELLVGPLTLGERDRYCVEAAVMEPLLISPRACCQEPRRSSTRSSATVLAAAGSRSPAAAARWRAPFSSRRDGGSSGPRSAPCS